MDLKVVIFGGSAGSLDVLFQVLPFIQKDQGIAYILILHRKDTHKAEHLVQLLATKCTIPVKEAEDKEAINQDHIYLAPAGYHLLIEQDRTFSLDVSEKINYSRPSIDVSFSTAAETFKENLIAILLSGGNADGCFGLSKVKQLGGRTAIQAPKTALVPFMPESALKAGVVEVQYTPEEISRLLQNISSYLSQK